VLGGQLSDRYGGSLILAAGLAGWSLCTLLTPWAAGHSAAALLAARAGLGMAQGVAFPAIHSLLAKGVPHSHRSGAIGEPARPRAKAAPRRAAPRRRCPPPAPAFCRRPT
jgi:MFS family permease